MKDEDIISQSPEKAKCETLSYSGLDSDGLDVEIECGNKAVAMFDMGTQYKFAICQPCLDEGCFNPARITMLPKEDEISEQN